MHHMFLICSSVNGYLSCFHLLAIVDPVATNMGVTCQPVLAAPQLSKMLFLYISPHRDICFLSIPLSYRPGRHPFPSYYHDYTITTLQYTLSYFFMVCMYSKMMFITL